MEIPCWWSSVGATYENELVPETSDQFAEGERCQALRACAGTAVQAVLFLHTPLGRVGLQALVQSDWSFGAFGAVVRPRRTPSSRDFILHSITWSY